MRKILLLLSLAAFVNGYAQNADSCDDEDFRHVMRELVSKGNLYYETCDRFGMSQMIDSISTRLQQRSLNGKLDRTDSLEFTADLYKLQGSFHYENSYYDSKSHEKAHENYQKALRIYQNETVFENDLRCEPMIHRELAQLYYKEANYQEAYNHTKMAYDAFVKAVDLGEIDYDDPDFLDIQTQMAICQARMGDTKSGIAMMDKLIKSYQVKEERYGEALRKKAKILMLQEEKGGKVGRKEALDCYKTYFNLKKKDALAHFIGMSSKEREMYWMRIRPFVTDCYRLEDADAGFLYDVTLFAKGLLLQLDSAGGGRQTIHATWQMVQQRLNPDECAMEMIQYEKHGIQQMAALLLKSTGKPVFVKMAQPDSVWSYKIGEYTIEERLRQTHDLKRINRVYDDSTGIYRMIWNNNLITAISNAKRVFFAPDGYAHRMAIEYMIPEEAPIWRLYRLTSTRELLLPQSTLTGCKALIVGDVNYQKANEWGHSQNDALAYQHMKGMAFREITESKEEIDSILICRHNVDDTLITQTAATEETFRRLSGNYPIVHISTHGKFNSRGASLGNDLKPCLADESLSENIIALAGINYAVQNTNFDPLHQLDGILSAREIASLDMTETRLVVLACCESGLGEITSDGVYGIQRGLKNSGVKAIVMSLWEAESTFTKCFMVAFYERLSKGHSVSEAFWNAREQYIDTEESSCRNVFVLIDATE